MITITKKANTTGCPLVNGGSPSGCIPIVIVDDDRTSNGWLRDSSTLFASVNLGTPVNVDDPAIVIARTTDDFVMCHARTVAERAAAVTAAAALATEAAKAVTANTNLDAYLTVVRGTAAGSRTPEQRVIYALVKILTGKE